MLRKHRAEKHPMPWIIILSAKYGALLHDDLIEDYDQRMTPAREDELKYRGYMTHGLLVRNRLAGSTSRLCISGEQYAGIFMHWAATPTGPYQRLESQNINIVEGGIGRKLHALRLVLDSLQRRELLSPQLSLIDGD
jgi:hypothetical protein